MKRSSSPGNPYHAKDGKFTTGPKADIIAKHEKDYYADRTEQRKAKVLLKADTPVGRVRITQRSVYHIRKGHSLMVSQQNREAIKDVLSNPQYIFRSSETGEGKASRIVFFGKSQKATFRDRFLIKVIAQEEGAREYAVITAFPVKAVKGKIGEKIYEKEK